MKISIVICSNNLERYPDLIDLFKSIENQKYTNLEIVFVSDHNQELLNKVKNYFKPLPKKIKLLMNTNKSGLSNARNFGINNSDGNIISFVDDDAILYNYWAEELIKTFKLNNEIGCVTGDIKPHWMMKKPEWFPYELYWIISCSYTMTPKKIQEVRNGFGTNISFKKELFNLVGQFNPKLGYNGEKVIDGEEVDFCIRIKNKTNYKIIFNPDVRIKHKVYPFRVTLKNVIKKSYGDGYAKGLMRKKFKTNKQTKKVENNYLKHLLLQFYPKTLIQLFIHPTTNIKKLIFVSFCIFFVFCGLLKYKLIK